MPKKTPKGKPVTGLKAVMLLATLAAAGVRSADAIAMKPGELAGNVTRARKLQQVKIRNLLGRKDEDVRPKDLDGKQHGVRLDSTGVTKPLLGRKENGKHRGTYYGNSTTPATQPSHRGKAR